MRRRSIADYQPPGHRSSLFDGGATEPDLGDERLRYLTWRANSSACFLTEEKVPKARPQTRTDVAHYKITTAEASRLGTRGTRIG